MWQLIKMPKYEQALHKGKDRYAQKKMWRGFHILHIPCTSWSHHCSTSVHLLIRMTKLCLLSFPDCLHSCSTLLFKHPHQSVANSSRKPMKYWGADLQTLYKQQEKTLVNKKAEYSISQYLDLWLSLEAKFLYAGMKAKWLGCIATDSPPRTMGTEKSCLISQIHLY